MSEPSATSNYSLTVTTTPMKCWERETVASSLKKITCFQFKPSAFVGSSVACIGINSQKKLVAITPLTDQSEAPWKESVSDIQAHGITKVGDSLFIAQQNTEGPLEINEIEVSGEGEIQIINNSIIPLPYLGQATAIKGISANGKVFLLVITRTGQLITVDISKKLVRVNTVKDESLILPDGSSPQITATDVNFVGSSESEGDTLLFLTVIGTQKGKPQLAFVKAASTYNTVYIPQNNELGIGEDTLLGAETIQHPDRSVSIIISHSDAEGNCKLGELPLGGSFENIMNRSALSSLTFRKLNISEQPPITQNNSTYLTSFTPGPIIAYQFQQDTNQCNHIYANDGQIIWTTQETQSGSMIFEPWEPLIKDANDYSVCLNESGIIELFTSVNSIGSLRLVFGEEEIEHEPLRVVGAGGDAYILRSTIRITNSLGDTMKPGSLMLSANDFMPVNINGEPHVLQPNRSLSVDVNSMGYLSLDYQSSSGFSSPSVVVNASFLSGPAVISPNRNIVEAMTKISSSDLNQQIDGEYMLPDDVRSNSDTLEQMTQHIRSIAQKLQDEQIAYVNRIENTQGKAPGTGVPASGPNRGVSPAPPPGGITTNPVDNGSANDPTSTIPTSNQPVGIKISINKETRKISQVSSREMQDLQERSNMAQRDLIMFKIPFVGDVLDFLEDELIEGASVVFGNTGKNFVEFVFRGVHYLFEIPDSIFDLPKTIVTLLNVAGAIQGRILGWTYQLAANFFGFQDVVEVKNQIKAQAFTIPSVINSALDGLSGMENTVLSQVSQIQNQIDQMITSMQGTGQTARINSSDPQKLQNILETLTSPGSWVLEKLESELPSIQIPDIPDEISTQIDNMINFDSMTDDIEQTIDNLINDTWTTLNDLLNNNGGNIANLLIADLLQILKDLIDGLFSLLEDMIRMVFNIFTELPNVLESILSWLDEDINIPYLSSFYENFTARGFHKGKASILDFLCFIVAAGQSVAQEISDSVSSILSSINLKQSHRATMAMTKTSKSEEASKALHLGGALFMELFYLFQCLSIMSERSSESDKDQSPENNNTDPDKSSEWLGVIAAVNGIIGTGMIHPFDFEGKNDGEKRYGVGVWAGDLGLQVIILVFSFIKMGSKSKNHNKTWYKGVDRVGNFLTLLAGGYGFSINLASAIKFNQYTPTENGFIAHGIFGILTAFGEFKPEVKENNIYQTSLAGTAAIAMISFIVKGFEADKEDEDNNEG